MKPKKRFTLFTSGTCGERPDPTSLKFTLFLLSRELLKLAYLCTSAEASGLTGFDSKTKKCVSMPSYPVECS